MSICIDFTQGGYKGDAIEEAFADLTKRHMPFWWHFREVLRSSDRASPLWKKSDGTALSDDEQRELVALSLLNYCVYSEWVGAFTFLTEMKRALNTALSPDCRLFEVRRRWKALYSSLYTSLNALCNIVCVVVGHKSPFGQRPGVIWNYTPRHACNLVNGRGIRELAEPLDRCRARLEIRDHLDHYWIIWHRIDHGRLLLDDNFKKGYVPIDPDHEVSPTVDAAKQALNHIGDIQYDFDLIYRELSVVDGYLDQYLAAKEWKIDYSNYGPPHNGQRPTP